MDFNAINFDFKLFAKSVCKSVYFYFIHRMVSGHDSCYRHIVSYVAVCGITSPVYPVASGRNHNYSLPSHHMKLRTVDGHEVLYSNLEIRHWRGPRKAKRRRACFCCISHALQTGTPNCNLRRLRGTPLRATSWATDDTFWWGAHIPRRTQACSSLLREHATIHS